MNYLQTVGRLVCVYAHRLSLAVCFILCLALCIINTYNQFVRSIFARGNGADVGSRQLLSTTVAVYAGIHATVPKKPQGLLIKVYPFVQTVPPVEKIIRTRGCLNVACSSKSMRPIIRIRPDRVYGAASPRRRPPPPPPPSHASRSSKQSA